MKAYVYEEYGWPDALEMREVARPVPADDEVLVKIEALSLNPAEWHRLRGEIVILRLAEGLRRPRTQIIGADFAGRVTAVGQHVSSHKVGDAVYGRSERGGFAEYVAVSGERVARMPNNLTFGEAAAVPLGALTGLQALRKGEGTAGQRVLINGASGGIGTFTVQMAKSMGMEVTGICSTRNVELVRSLGAAHVLDYTQMTIPPAGRRYELIIDLIGNMTVSDYKRALAPGGRCVVVGFENMARLLQVMTVGSWVSLTGGVKIDLINTSTNAADLDDLREQIESGALRVIIDVCHPFEQLPAALTYLGSRRARGKIVVTLDEGEQARVE